MSDPNNPFEDIERLFRRMSEQFGETTEHWPTADPMGVLSRESTAMPVDLVENEDEFVLTVDLPGHTREDVSIRVNDRRVRIEAERTGSEDTESSSVIRKERHHQTTRRSVRLPEPVETGDITATMQNGVLTVTLPRQETSDAHTVEIG